MKIPIMWPFTKRDGGLEERLDALEAAAADLQSCCSANAENFLKAKSTLASMRSDIDLQWEKVNRAIGRFAKRDAAEDSKQNGDPDQLDINELIMRGDRIG